MIRRASSKLGAYTGLSAVGLLASLVVGRPELWVQRIRGEDVVAEALESVPTPPAEDVLEVAG